MTYRGHIKNGVVVLEGSPPLAEGTPVRVEPEETTKVQDKTIWDELLEIAGTAKGLPPDLAENHDYYLHGRPKRQ